MTFKRNWDYTKKGCVSLFKPENSACHTMAIDCLALKAGGHYKGKTGDCEYAFTILGGTLDIRGDGFEYKEIGARKNVFDGKATAVYVPMGRKFEITALTDIKVIIAKCAGKKGLEAQIVRPEDIIVKKLGKPGFEREAHFIVDERIQANRIYIGENFINGGQWSGYPGHKHDVNALPAEGFAEEIYYFEFDRDTGYGVQQVYTLDKKIDEIYVTRNGDAVEIPKGYHPGTVAPGYKGYLLWLMSCDNRGFYRTIDPDHAWME